MAAPSFKRSAVCSEQQAARSTGRIQADQTTSDKRRRGCGVGSGHAEHQFARKTTGNKVTANDERFALAA
jgi:hypothetical protein